MPSEIDLIGIVIIIVRQPIKCNSHSTKINFRTIDWHSCQYQFTFLFHALISCFIHLVLKLLEITW